MSFPKMLVVKLEQSFVILTSFFDFTITSNGVEVLYYEGGTNALDLATGLLLDTSTLITGGGGNSFSPT